MKSPKKAVAKNKSIAKLKNGAEKSFHDGNDEKRNIIYLRFKKYN